MGATVSSQCLKPEDQSQEATRPTTYNSLVAVVILAPKVDTPVLAGKADSVANTLVCTAAILDSMVGTMVVSMVACTKACTKACTLDSTVRLLALKACMLAELTRPTVHTKTHTTRHTTSRLPLASTNQCTWDQLQCTS